MHMAALTSAADVSWRSLQFQAAIHSLPRISASGHSMNLSLTQLQSMSKQVYMSSWTSSRCDLADRILLARVYMLRLHCAQASGQQLVSTGSSSDNNGACMRA